MKGNSGDASSTVMWRVCAPAEMGPAEKKASPAERAADARVGGWSSRVMVTFGSVWFAFAGRVAGRVDAARSAIPALAED